MISRGPRSASARWGREVFAGHLPWNLPLQQAAVKITLRRFLKRRAGTLISCANIGHPRGLRIQYR